MSASPTAPAAQVSAPDAGASQVKGEFVRLDGESFYRIANYDALDPFFMTLVSDADHWLFISSNGCLTAGRKNSQNSLFPYYGEDKIHDMPEATGPKTICRVEKDGAVMLWEPFSDRYRGAYRLRRNLYKSECGNQLVFEEINSDLEIAFRYRWAFSDAFGIVRASRIENLSRRIIAVDFLDGLQNLLPAGVHPDFQLMFGGLVDAYKKNELEGRDNLGLFTMSSVPGDKAEPMESLRANTCFAIGLQDPVILLSSRQLNAFRSGKRPIPERDIRGARGAYFVCAGLRLEPETSETWSLVAEVDQGPADVVALLDDLAQGDLQRKLDEDIAKGTARLKKIVGSADGLQRTRDVNGNAHHFANCMFNVMRGGIFLDGYAIEKQDLAASIRRFDKPAYEAHAAWLDLLPATLTLPELEREVAGLGDARLERLAKEYLPLSFSRRHGDPSRPWNIFSIDLKDKAGKRILAYQGNWRDIFQNWEALCLSFPEFTEGFICKFLNTTTADGYNPYRIGKLGFDWEKPHPGEPWANIGYWGDHQLIYLLRLLECSAKYNPGRLEGYLAKDFFVYADVPYDIKPYGDLVKDPKDTIAYNRAREKAISDRVSRVGMDGQYVHDAKGVLHTVNLSEKLLVPLLAKVSNLIPGAGIWLNTQRPEWNDANNALAGFGLSMVTLYYARRYAAFMKDLLAKSGRGKFAISAEVATWLRAGNAALKAFGKQYLGKAEKPHPRGLVEPLGQAAADYRIGLYSRSLSGTKVEVEAAEFMDFLDLTLAYAEEAVRLNKRSDGLYHSYNVFDPATMKVRYLYEMLEGQVAVLSSGALSPREAADVLRALRQSRMYRADQHSYLLYPDKDLPRFTAKNRIPPEALARFALFRKLVAEADTTLIEADIHGDLHFNGGIKNAGDLAAALAEVRAAGDDGLVAKEGEAIAALYEEAFDHQSFTGRSGSFFGYEGLGSIYWHMVGKLLLAAQENFFAAIDAGDGQAAAELRDHYYDIRAGLGFNKTPDLYGAFPSDPYSHTPAGAGAKQPGMTGQVKEAVLTRAGELGVRMDAGRLRFHPLLLSASEFLDEPGTFEFVNVAGAFEAITLESGSLAFTVCQVPVVYHLSDQPRLLITRQDGATVQSSALELDREACRAVYSRTGSIVRIDALIPRSLLA